MRTHVWRKQLSRLSQRGQRLPFQRRRAFHSVARQCEAHPNPNQETANQESSTESTIRPSLSSRRAGRSAVRRPKEVAPFTVPDWFLRHNVRLHAPSTTSSADLESRCWTLVDRDSGHTVLTLPFTINPSNESNDFFTPSAKPNEQETQENDAAPPNEIARAVNQLSLDSTAHSPDARLLLSLQLQLLLHAAFSHVGPQSSRYTKFNIDLNTRDHSAHKELDAYVQQVADLVQADLIELDANDLAELAQDYVEPQAHASGSISSLAYDTFKGTSAASTATPIQIDILDEAANEDSQDDGDSELAPDYTRFASGSMPSIGDISGIMEMLKNNQPALEKALSQIGGSGAGIIPFAVSTEMPKRKDQSSSEEYETQASPLSTWEELKLATLLDTVVDSVQIKKDSPEPEATKRFLYDTDSTQAKSVSVAPSAPSKDTLERFLADLLGKRIDSKTQSHNMQSDVKKEAKSSNKSQAQQRIIIHVRDMDHIRHQPRGETIVQKLVQVVQRRRKDGEQIVILGTTANSQQAPPPPGQHDDEPDFHYIKYPSGLDATPSIGSQLARHRLLERRAAVEPNHLLQPKAKPDITIPDLTQPSHPFESSSEPTNTHSITDQLHQQEKGIHERTVAKPGYHRLFEINMRHIHAMVRRLNLSVSESFLSADTRSHLNIPGTSKLGDMTLPQDEVQQIVLYADSLRSLYTTSPALETFHIALAVMLSDAIENALSPQLNGISLNSVIPPARERGESQKRSGHADDSKPPKLDMEKLKKSCSKHETRLLPGVVDPASLRTTFNDVHADANTIDSLKTLTSLTLLRPEAFSYGVLAADRLPGLLLYGPPGTGKTLLAKAVAKESSATVLEVSGAQVYEKYVGEGEKMVNAVFSLAKKLSPCVVFIDEADALFGSRGGSNNRTSHREIINQFLRGWDGMDDHSVFMMVATNRPFDLDDAVLRRLPRRLLVDLPLAKDREGILGIHLKGETLDPAVSLSELAKKTPLYSGSDLKNLCVAAALAAVRDENIALEAARAKGDSEFKLPARRTLEPSHFEKALQEISASVSEDMATLGAIRKFDEQYGEKRARTKKPGYGFGLGSSNVIDETGARVRPGEGSG